MLRRAWELPGLGRVRVDVPVPTLVDEIDAAWPELRPAHQQGAHLRWSTVLHGRIERFAVVGAAREILSIWVSGRHRPLRLPEGPAYRLDYFEVHPSLRGTVLGAFTLSLIAGRALELGASHLILGAIPGVAPFYEKMGGSRGLVAGWQAEKGLVPFVFRREALVALKESSDAFLTEI